MYKFIYLRYPFYIGKVEHRRFAENGNPEIELLWYEPNTNKRTARGHLDFTKALVTSNLGNNPWTSWIDIDTAIYFYDFYLNSQNMIPKRFLTGLMDSKNFILRFNLQFKSSFSSFFFSINEIYISYNILKIFIVLKNFL